MSGTASDNAESIATIHALDAGINLLDTGDCYGMGHNELLIARALAGRDRDQVLICVPAGSEPAGLAQGRGVARNRPCLCPVSRQARPGLVPAGQEDPHLKPAPTSGRP